MARDPSSVGRQRQEAAHNLVSDRGEGVGRPVGWEHFGRGKGHTMTMQGNKRAGWWPLAAAAAVILSGCGSLAQADPEQVRSEVQAMAEEMHAVSQEELQQLSADKLGAPGEVLTEEDRQTAARVEDETDDVLASIEAISADGQKAVADYLTDILPAAEYFNLDGLSDAERAVLAQESVLSMAYLQMEGPVTVDELGPEDVEVIDAEHVRITVSFGGDTSDPVEVYLVKDGDEWKVDGGKALEQRAERER